MQDEQTARQDVRSDSAPKCVESSLPAFGTVTVRLHPRAAILSADPSACVLLGIEADAQDPAWGIDAPSADALQTCAARALESKSQTLVCDLRTSHGGRWLRLGAAIGSAVPDQPISAHLVDVTDIHCELDKLRAEVLADGIDERRRDMDAFRTSLAALAAESTFYVELNLTAGEVDAEEGDVRYKSLAATDGSIVEYVKYMSKRFVTDADRDIFCEFVSREHLIGLYASGVREDGLDFQVREDEEVRWVHMNAQLTSYPGSDDVKALITFVDMEGQRREIKRLAEAASHDSLTNLLNHDATERAIRNKLLTLQQDEEAVLFMVDLDNFKQINDTLGHLVGDQALIRVARVLSDMFRASDVVGRMGGDEFMVFISVKKSARVVRKKAAALCSALQFTIGADPGLTLSASVGVAVASAAGMEFEEIYKQSDMALYQAKHAGKNCYAIIQADDFQDAAVEQETVPVSPVQLQVLLQYMDGGLFLIEAGTAPRLLYISPSYQTALGSHGDKTFDMRATIERIYEKDREGLMAALGKAAADGHPVDATFRVRQGTTIFWRHMRAVRIPYDASTEPVLIAIVTDASQLRRQEEELAESTERLRVAFDQTSRTLWEVDVATRTFSVFDHTTMKAVPDLEMPDFPESLIAEGWVHPDFEDAIRAFAKDMLAGKSEDSVGFKLHYMHFANLHEYGWTAMSYHMLYDEDGEPRKAIGITEELPTVTAAQVCYLQEQQVFSALQPYLTLGLHVNLITDTVDKMCLRGVPLNPRSGSSSYTEMLLHTKRFVEPQDFPDLRAQFCRANLVDLFGRGVTNTTVRYRYCDDTGVLRWYAETASLVNDPITRELHAFIYVRDIDNRLARESVVRCEITHDPLMYLYTRDTFEALADAAIAGADASARCALAYLHIGGLKKLRAKSDDDEAAKRACAYVGKVLRVLLDDDFMIAQQSEGTVVLFGADCPPRAQVTQRIEDAVAFMRSLFAHAGIDVVLTFEVGVATSIARKADRKKLLSRAQKNAKAFER